MDKEVAKSLAASLNKVDDIFFANYVEHRLDELRKALENNTDPIRIYHLQGQIKEVKRLLTLKAEVLEARGT